ncbi:MAG: RNA polymerase sigma factor RpoE [Calditrichia bacterium]
MKNLSDVELVQKCQIELPGNTTAFNEIVRRYKDYLYSVALNKLQNTEDAQDAMQETFIRAYHGLKNFRGDSELKTWLTVIVGNVCLSIILTNKRKLWKYHVTLDGQADLENIYLSLISQQEEFDFWRKIGEILRKIFMSYRKVFILRYFKDYTFQALALRIKSTVGAVKMKVKRAKDQFFRIFMRG